MMACCKRELRMQNSKCVYGLPTRLASSVDTYVEL